MAGHFEKGKWVEDPEPYVKPDVYIPSNEAAVEAIVNRNLDLIDGLTDDVRASMLDILSDGMTRGLGIDEIIKNMEEAGVALGYAAERIARTEIMYSLNQGAINRYKQDGIDQVQWLAGPDDRACPVCLGYHLQTFPIDQAPANPAHPNCRCCFGPHFSDFDDQVRKDREQFEQDVTNGKAPYDKTKWNPDDLKKWKDAGERFLNKKNTPQGSVTFEDWLKTHPPEETVVIQKKKQGKKGEPLPKK